jgi:hypothetical protein
MNKLVSVTVRPWLQGGRHPISMQQLNLASKPKTKLTAIGCLPLMKIRIANCVDPQNFFSRKAQ